MTNKHNVSQTVLL